MKTLTIGRDASNNIVLSDEKVSRNHAHLIITGEGQIIVRDLKSTNGTFVNGNKITEIYLKSSDILKCANVYVDWEKYFNPTMLKPSSNQDIPVQAIVKNILNTKRRQLIIGNYIAIAFLFFLPDRKSTRLNSSH